MTAVSGASLRTGEAYWELSGPLPLNRVVTCRACKNSIVKGSLVYVRDGRKLRFFYHEECFTGDADPRTQLNSSFMEKDIYHKNTAPRISSLEGPKACRDADGRVLGRAVFKDSAPSVLGAGKWSVASRGYQPVLTSTGLSVTQSHSSLSPSTSSPISKRSHNGSVSNLLRSPNKTL